MKQLMKVILGIILIASIFPMQTFARSTISTKSFSNEEQKTYNNILKSLQNVEASTYFNSSEVRPEEIGAIVNKVVEDHPEIFYYNGATTFSTGTIKFKYDGSKQSILKKKNKIDAEVKRIINVKIKKNMSDIEKIKAIHDYLVLSVKYDYKNHRKDKVSRDSYEVFGALVNKVAVCDGYSKSMQLLLNNVGVETIVVTGSSKGESHSWNMVKINGEYYHIDTTWDDPIPNKTGVVNYHYFLLSNAQLKKDHSWKEKEFPNANSEKYRYFHNMGNVIEKSGTYYFSNNKNDQLFKMDKKSNKQLKVVNDRVPFLAVYGQWIYYSNYSDGGYLYKVKLNGQNKTKIKSTHVVDLYVKSKVLYYKENESGKIHQLALNAK